VRSAVFSPNGERIMSWSHDKTVRVWNTLTGALISVLSTADSSYSYHDTVVLTMTRAENQHTVFSDDLFVVSVENALAVDTAGYEAEPWASYKSERFLGLVLLRRHVRRD
jgi:WD40 repeat protein